MEPFDKIKKKKKHKKKRNQQFLISKFEVGFLYKNQKISEIAKPSSENASSSPFIRPSPFINAIKMCLAPFLLIGEAPLSLEAAMAGRDVWFMHQQHGHGLICRTVNPRPAFKKKAI